MERDDRLYGGMTIVSHRDRGDGKPVCGATEYDFYPLYFPDNLTCPDCRKIAQEERERYEQEHS